MDGLAGGELGNIGRGYAMAAVGALPGERVEGVAQGEPAAALLLVALDTPISDIKAQTRCVTAPGATEYERSPDRAVGLVSGLLHGPMVASEGEGLQAYKMLWSQCQAPLHFA